MLESILLKLKKFFLLFLVVVVAVIWYTVFYFEEHQNLVVNFFDIGQGDSEFIEIPGGNQILIDGGPSKNILSKLGRTMPFWDRDIDLVILTHAHADHVSGLVEVLKRYKIGMILESGEEYSTPEYHEWHEIIKDKNIPVIIARGGQVVHLSRGAEMDVLSPLGNYNGLSLKNPHDANVSTKLIYSGTSILFMGDAEKMIEYSLISQDAKKLKSDILKIGHHGSKTSSSEEFLKAVSPRLAVISVGRKNRYGHPHQEILDRLEKFGIKTERTDLAGDIVVKSNVSFYQFEK